MTVDTKRQRLFVVELGNNSLGVVGLAVGKVLRTIAGLREPQGVVYVSFADSVFVANAGDGSLRMLRGSGAHRAHRTRRRCPQHAPWTRRADRVLVGYGKGALAAIDRARQTKTVDIRLKGHQEGFKIDETGSQVFINVPDAREIEAVDLAAGST
jgi:hypothetical protein